MGAKPGAGGIGGAGVVLAGGGGLNNRATITGGAGGASGVGSAPSVAASGGAGASLSGGGLVANTGTILGGKGAGALYAGFALGQGGMGGAGLVFADGGKVTRNTGRIAGGEGWRGGTGVSIAGSGAVANDGTISGGAADRPDGGTGGDGVSLGSGSVTNAGTIVGGAGVAAGGAGIRIAGAGTVSNGRKVLGGAASAGSGRAGIDIVGAGTVTNTGGVTGGAGGPGAALAGGQGVLLEHGGMVHNDGRITGGAAGAGGGQGTGVGLWSGGVVVNGSSTDHAAVIFGGRGVFGGIGGPTTVTNFGTIEGTAGIGIRLRSAADRLIVEGGSTVVGQVIADGGTLELAGGTGTITGLSQLSGGVTMSFAGFEHIAIDAGATWTLAGDSYLASHLTLSATGDLILAGTLTGGGLLSLSGGKDRIADSTLDMAHVQIDGAEVTLGGTVINRGRIAGAGAHLLVDVLGATLQGGGVLTLDKASEITSNLGGALTNSSGLIQGAGQIGAGKMTLVNGAAGHILGNATAALVIDTGGNMISNAGTIAAAAGGGVEIKSAIDNTGLLIASGGVLTLDKAVTGDGAARIVGGTLFARAAFEEAVAFTGVAGTLELARSRTYSGEVSGFSKGGATHLDLRDIGFVSADEATFTGDASGGVLEVSDGTHTAKIKLVGDFIGVAFTAASDGGGGVTVTGGAATASVHAFVAASAARPGSGGGAAPASHGTTSPGSQALGLVHGGRWT